MEKYHALLSHDAITESSCDEDCQKDDGLMKEDVFSNSVIYDEILFIWWNRV